MQRWKAEYLVKGSLVLLYNRKNRGGMFSLCQSYIKKKGYLLNCSQYSSSEFSVNQIKYFQMS